MFHCGYTIMPKSNHLTLEQKRFKCVRHRFMVSHTKPGAKMKRPSATIAIILGIILLSHLNPLVTLNSKVSLSREIPTQGPGRLPFAGLATTSSSVVVADNGFDG